MGRDPPQAALRRITVRTYTSPNAYRWQQSATWTRELPAKAITNVSLDLDVWAHLGNDQPKTCFSTAPDSRAGQ